MFSSLPLDNHDIISIKLFQLTVERTPEEESIDWTKIEPGVNFLKSPKDNVDDPTAVTYTRISNNETRPAIPSQAGRD